MAPDSSRQAARRAEVEFDGWPALALENEHARLVVIPELGAKIVSLRSQSSGTEFLWKDPTRPYRRPVFGDAFGNYDASGFDECFPTIAECPYPEEPWAGVTMADHGELWCAPWRYELPDERTLYLHAYGVRFAYHFEKWIILSDGAPHFTLRYRLTNLTPFPFLSIWSAHPLFAAKEGMRVVLPGAPRMRLTHAIGARIGGSLLVEYTWPWLEGTDGRPLDYSQIGSPDLDANDKVYVDTPAEGWCALYQPESDEFVGFTLSAAETPFVGVCINHGGWPFTGARGFWAAVEPCTGWPDRLDEAARVGAYGTLDAWGTREWTLGLCLGTAETEERVAHLMHEVRR